MKLFEKFTKQDLIFTIVLFPLYAMVGVFGFFAVYDWFVPPVTRLGTIMTTTYVHQGDDMVMFINLNRNRSCSVRYDRILKNMDTSLEYEVNNIEGNIKIETNAYTAVRQIIPYTIPSGKYYYFARADYTCNIYHRVFGPYSYETPKFGIEILSKYSTNQR